MELKSSLVIGASIVAASVIVAFAPKLAEERGRFQLGGTPGHAYVLDTATGQVWETFAVPSAGSDDRDFKSPKLGRKQ